MKKYWPIIALVIVELGIIITNVTPHTFLMGWDNLLPEFNFPLNLGRSIFGVWLEYRGTGLYDGMSHIANIIQIVSVWLMSFVVPQTFLRYGFNLGLHILGGIGAYFLVKKLFKNRLIAFIGALFYMLNLATVQMFYAPLEAFSVHFASLPWIARAVLNYYENASKKSYLVFLLIALLSTPQYFVTTLLLPTAILIGSISLKQRFTQIFKIGLGFLLVNAFWLLPYIYGIPHNAPVITTAKINQMSSNEIFVRNQVFGNVKDVLELHGFSLDYSDLGPDGTSVYMMAPWRDFIKTPLMEVFAGIIAILTIIGVISLALKPKRQAVVFLLPFVTGFILLGNNIPGLREITTWLQNTIPFFKEAFRFTFTKFGLLFSLSYTIMFIAGFTTLLGKNTKKIVLIISSCAAIVGIIFLSAPTFQGNFLYKNLRVTLPQEYLQFFSYANTLNPNARMMVLPQDQYWSWKYYRFGYRGSGFLWMGLPQAILDRAFDPWSATNENYYWELSHALYAKDTNAIESVFRKYDVHYILLDENLTTSNNGRSLFILDAKTLLSKMPNIKKTANFGKLTLYERTDDTSNSFISLVQKLPTVAPVYSWTDNDVAYAELGDYIATNENANVTYQNRSFFTKRSASERDFDVNSIPIEQMVYDSTASADLIASNVKTCGLSTEGSASAQHIGASLRFTSLNQRGCLSFDIPSLSHRQGYLIAVTSQHINGRPLMISFINDTAKHVEEETYLPDDLAAHTTSFILPPLAPDGLGYTIYISNDSIGQTATVNDISRIRIYTIPYEQMVTMHTGTIAPIQSLPNNVQVDHPNPSFYKATVQSGTGTLILSQSFDTGWIAFQNGKILDSHVLVNNWENGWQLNPGQSGTIYIFFWPQLLEWLGFVLLPLPFIFAKKLAS